MKVTSLKGILAATCVATLAVFGFTSCDGLTTVADPYVAADGEEEEPTTYTVTGGAWWTVFLADEDTEVASGKSYSVSMTMTANNSTNWTLAPDVILRASDPTTEYAVLRLDNYGWGTGYSSDSNTSDWDWTTFVSDLSGAAVKITVTNNGDGTALVRYDVTTTSGTTHYQTYTVTVTADDLYVNLCFENCSAEVNY